jgi:hypothetical protein
MITRIPRTELLEHVRAITKQWILGVYESFGGRDFLAKKLKDVLDMEISSDEAEELFMEAISVRDHKFMQDGMITLVMAFAPDENIAKAHKMIIEMGNKPPIAMSLATASVIDRLKAT